MKLGLGLYRHMLTRENFQFARQAGATHIVAHLVDYFKGSALNPRDNQPTGTEHGWGMAGDPDELWSLEELLELRRAIEAEGLKLEAIENFDPAHWHDVLLDGPKKKTAVRKRQNHHSQSGQGRDSHHGLQLQHRGRLRPDARALCSRWRHVRGHGRSVRHADTQWHGLEHGL